MAFGIAKNPLFNDVREETRYLDEYYDLPIGTNIPKWISDFEETKRLEKRIEADLELAREGNEAAMARLQEQIKGDLVLAREGDEAAMARLKQSGVQDRQLKEMGIQAQFETARAKSGAIGKGLEFLSPFISQFGTRPKAGDFPTVGPDVLAEIERSITEQGRKRQGRLSSLHASRGVFRGEAGVAAAGQVEAGTRSLLAGKIGEFAQQDANRALQLEMSRQQSLIALLMQRSGLVGMDPGTPGGSAGTGQPAPSSDLPITAPAEPGDRLGFEPWLTPGGGGRHSTLTSQSGKFTPGGLSPEFGLPGNLRQRAIDREKRIGPGGKNFIL